MADPAATSNMVPPTHGSDNNSDVPLPLQMVAIKQEDDEDVVVNNNNAALFRPIVPNDQQQDVPSLPTTTTTTTSSSSSGVHGIGQWNAWQRNFRTPLLALLDIFDNAVDASLVMDAESIHFQGKGSIQVELDSKSKTGICMMNNCHSLIPPLKEVLEIFRSHKSTTSVGENGVGLKQACASLTDLSFIITRNKTQISVGIIAKALQKEDGCVLPHVVFDLQTTSDIQQVQKLTSLPAFRQCIEKYGNGSLNVGIKQLFYACKRLERGKWAQQDHVFCVLLHKLRHFGGTTTLALDNGHEAVQDDYEARATTLMDQLAEALPRQYIHIPDDFDIQVNQKKIRFQYWERRLVELSSFSVKIDPTNFWKTADDWNNTVNASELRIYCGFDPIRLEESRVQTTKQHKQKMEMATLPLKSTTSGVANLYVYSRQSGRLIKYERDARSLLCLPNSGTDFGQGLTIILDDDLGTLPLNPTKQDMAFGQEANGDVHEDNLYAWLSAYSHAYYRHHLTEQNEKKTVLTKEVLACGNQAKELQERENVVKSFMKGQFTTFDQYHFRRNHGVIRVAKITEFHKVPGPDTLLQLKPPEKNEVARKKSARKKTATKLTATAAAPEHVLMGVASLRPQCSLPILTPDYNEDDDDTTFNHVDDNDDERYAAATGVAHMGGTQYRIPRKRARAEEPAAAAHPGAAARSDHHAYGGAASTAEVERLRQDLARVEEAFRRKEKETYQLRVEVHELKEEAKLLGQYTQGLEQQVKDGQNTIETLQQMLSRERRKSA